MSNPHAAATAAAQVAIQQMMQGGGFQGLPPMPAGLPGQTGGFQNFPLPPVDMQQLGGLMGGPINLPQLPGGQTFQFNAAQFQQFQQQQGQKPMQLPPNMAQQMMQAGARLPVPQQAPPMQQQQRPPQQVAPQQLLVAAQSMAAKQPTQVPLVQTSIPPQLLDRVAGKARIASIAKIFDPDVELEDDAVEMIDELMSRLVDDWTAMASEVAKARAMPSPDSGLPSTASPSQPPVLEPADFHAYIEQAYPYLTLPTDSISAYLVPKGPPAHASLEPLASKQRLALLPATLEHAMAAEATPGSGAAAAAGAKTGHGGNKPPKPHAQPKPKVAAPPGSGVPMPKKRGRPPKNPLARLAYEGRIPVPGAAGAGGGSSAAGAGAAKPAAAAPPAAPVPRPVGRPRGRPPLNRPPGGAYTHAVHAATKAATAGGAAAAPAGGAGATASVRHGAPAAGGGGIAAAGGAGIGSSGAGSAHPGPGRPTITFKSSAATGTGTGGAGAPAAAPKLKLFMRTQG